MTRLATKLHSYTAIGAAVLALGAGSASAQDEPFQMGALVSITGGGAAIGTAASMGWELAVEQLNESGGILGRQVELTIADSETDPTHGVSEARRLVENVGIEGMVGPVTSQETIPVTTVLTEGNIAQITTAASPTLTPELAPYHFSNSPTGLNQMIANIKYAIEELGAENIALISDNGGMSQAAAAEIAAYLEELGHPLVEVQEFAFRAEDMTPQIFSMRRSEADAVLLINSLVDDTRKFLQNREEIGWDVPVLGSLTLTNYAVGIARDLGEEVFEDVYSVQFSGMSYCEGDPVGESAFAKFAARANETYPDLASVGGPSGIAPYYVEPFILAQAIEGAGTTDGAEVAAWIEANAAEIDNMLGTFGASDENHFLPSADAMVVVRNPYQQREDGLVERILCDD
ncbi:ABC transporter substrate-binding protein [Thalassorhabdomicrobium marinisediminis]|uniref:Branched-chain amino acid ABC transporter substrate-binding protein n=1 Tax=Thalassorhabdomicrobium marinisediminis TaxID=2170577 RepID=A0A2T7FUB9_9RHOB|nr:ABC transporter substrate-binding protein [Thalassorhabdomicrobium marinisediminis]PVA05742.1 branched-chain amino acid ABC transporter substrate-binding protein [Thalassorhabdomicrobium marinisediminis]